MMRILRSFNRTIKKRAMEDSNYLVINAETAYQMAIYSFCSIICSVPSLSTLFYFTTLDERYEYPIGFYIYIYIKDTPFYHTVTVLASPLGLSGFNPRAQARS